MAVAVLCCSRVGWGVQMPNMITSEESAGMQFVYSFCCGCARADMVE